jgi:hypothetical protein
METYKEARTTISSDIREGDGDNPSISLSITVDHLDHNSPFELEFQENFNGEWVSLDEMLRLKRLINKAIRTHKAGFKV